MLGILGGMGPAATADFMAKLIALTPATCDQEHIPMIIANLPQIPDRSAAILGRGPDPLPMLLKGIHLLNDARVGAVAVPCNSSHHWYAQMSAASNAPILHIAQTAVAAIPAGTAGVAILATRGAIACGLYQRELEKAGLAFVVPNPDTDQAEVDATIRAVKGGQELEGGRLLQQCLDRLSSRGATCTLLACTEIPIAARHVNAPTMALVDTRLELARACVAYALARGWNKVSCEG